MTDWQEVQHAGKRWRYSRFQYDSYSQKMRYGSVPKPRYVYNWRLEVMKDGKWNFVRIFDTEDEVHTHLQFTREVSKGTKGDRIREILEYVLPRVVFIFQILSLVPLFVIPWIVWNVVPEASLLGKVSISVIAIGMFYGTIIGFMEG